MSSNVAVITQYRNVSDVWINDMPLGTEREGPEHIQPWCNIQIYSYDIAL